MKRSYLMLFLFSLSACSYYAPVTAPGNDNSFQAKALTASYQARKLQNFVTHEREAEIVREIAFQITKDPALLTQTFTTNMTLFNTIEDLTLVQDRIAISPSFANFFNYISGWTPASGPYDPGLNYDPNQPPAEPVPGPGDIYTIAGNGAGFSNTNDGQQATLASLSYPNGVALDSSNNVYFTTDSIRKIDRTTGIISKVAGTYDVYDYSGDNGPATSASFNYPQGMVFDSAGNLFVMDTYGQRIRRIDATTKEITTIAGNGDTCPDSTGTCGDSAEAASAYLTNASWIAIDNSDNIYLSDSGNQKIRKLVPNVGTNPLTYSISTIAGTGSQNPPPADGTPALSANLQYPAGIAVDNSTGDVYITCNSRIFKIAASDNKIYKVAGTGVEGSSSGDGASALLANLYYPGDLKIDSGKNLYFTEYNNSRVRKINSSDGKINTVAGNGTDANGDNVVQATSTSLNHPAGIAVDNAGNIYIADRDSKKIRKVNHL
jgi:sugar lactone lactonase YvrE